MSLITSGTRLFRYTGWSHVRCLVSKRKVSLRVASVLTSLASAAIEASIFISQAVWLIRTRGIRERAKEAEMSWDDFPEAQEWQQHGWRWKWKLNFSLRKRSDKVEGDDTGDVDHGNADDKKETTSNSSNSA